VDLTAQPVNLGGRSFWTAKPQIFLLGVLVYRRSHRTPQSVADPRLLRPAWDAPYRPDLELLGLQHLNPADDTDQTGRRKAPRAQGRDRRCKWRRQAVLAHSAAGEDLDLCRSRISAGRLNDLEAKETARERHRHYV